MRTTRLAAAIAALPFVLPMAAPVIAAEPSPSPVVDASPVPSATPAPPLPSPFPDDQPLLVSQLVVTLGMPGVDATVVIVASIATAGPALARPDDVRLSSPFDAGDAAASDSSHRDLSALSIEELMNVEVTSVDRKSTRLNSSHRT